MHERNVAVYVVHSMYLYRKSFQSYFYVCFFLTFLFLFVLRCFLFFLYYLMYSYIPYLKQKKISMVLLFGQLNYFHENSCLALTPYIPTPKTLRHYPHIYYANFTSTIQTISIYNCMT